MTEATERKLPSGGKVRTYRHESGAIDWQLRFDASGRMHGVERQEHEDGSRMYRALWRHGLQVGWQEHGTSAGV